MDWIKGIKEKIVDVFDDLTIEYIYIRQNKFIRFFFDWVLPLLSSMIVAILVNYFMRKWDSSSLTLCRNDWGDKERLWLFLKMMNIASKFMGWRSIWISWMRLIKSSQRLRLLLKRLTPWALRLSLARDRWVIYQIFSFYKLYEDVQVFDEYFYIILTIFLIVVGVVIA